MAARARRTSAVKTVGINVEGVTELSKALRRIDPELQKELRKTNREVARGVVVEARVRAGSVGRQQAKAAKSLRAVAGNNYAGVSLGGPGYEFALGAEFGSYRFKQFPPWRGNDSAAGYFLYPTIRDRADEIVETYDDAIRAMIRKAGLQ